jgi:predicted nucleic-acid-binding protein
MLAIDTNIVLRYLTDDDPEQSARARDLILNNAVLVSSTVLLEVEWVLGSAYGLTKDDRLSALEAFLGMPQVQPQDPDQVANSLAWARSGMGFADALHLASAQAAESFVTFDKQLATTAKRIGVPSVHLL